jgi:hypothetical protein
MRSSASAITRDWIMLKLRTLILAAALVVPATILVGQNNAEAQFRIGPHVGYSVDSETLFIGADSWIGMTSIGDRMQLHLNPAFSYYLIEGSASVISIDVNAPFMFEIPSLSFMRPYAAPGVAVRRVSVSLGPLGSLSDTQFGFNVIGGALFMPDSVVNPFTQLKLTIADGTDFAIMGGAMFKF